LRWLWIVSGVGARARTTLESASGAADQRIVLAGRMAVRNWVETGYAGFSSVSDVNLYFFIAPDVAAAWSTAATSICAMS